MIGIDWGTSWLRAYRLGPAGEILATRVRRRGILSLSEGEAFPTVLAESVGDWLAAGEERILLCGMVGSRQGWQETPYLPCPVDLSCLAAALVPLSFRGAEVRLVPGLSCRDRTGMPEVMRGEETQIFGALDPFCCAGHEVTVCLPGSHAKWVQVRDGTVLSFCTYLTGEAFAALSRHTLLARLIEAPTPHQPEAFTRGLARAQEQGGLLHHLFGVRAAALFGELHPAEAASYLSGLLIGHEIIAAREQAIVSPVLLVGSEDLVALYGTALRYFGIPYRLGPAEAAAIGLYRLGCWWR